MAIVVSGVSACGKSTIAEQLAKKLFREYSDADDFHSPEAIEKMHWGIALTDADRIPWLARLHDHLAHNKTQVLACSALKKSYRVELSKGLPVCFVQLEIDFISALRRSIQRSGHFFNRHLLTSQFDDLEPLTPDENGIIVSATCDTSEIIDTIISYLVAHADHHY